MNKNKFLLITAGGIMSLFLLSGCIQNDSLSANDEKKDTITEVFQEEIIEDKALLENVQDNGITKTGYFNGFSSENLAEFKVVQKTGETLRVFTMDNELKNFLHRKYENGEVKMQLTYMEATNGVSHPVIVKMKTLVN